MKTNLIILGIIIAILMGGVGGYLFLYSTKSTFGSNTEIVASQLEVPWAIDFLPDGKMIFTEKSGRISVVDQGQVKNVGNINVTATGEGGLLGIAVDPNFNQNKYIFVYYTKGNINRVSRFVLGDKIENETVILDNIPAAQNHNGGRIKFGPDGFLYVATGDAQNPQSAQDTSSLAGKILRINSDSTIPSDNPFGNYVYSYGHRNPQGLTWNEKGILYSSEHGATRNDEINIIQKGSNYGWPQQEGNLNVTGVNSPLITYADFTLAPSGLAYYQNSLYVAGLRGNQLRKIELSSDGLKVVKELELLNNLGRIREMVYHDGYLYISTSNRDGRGIPSNDDDKILRIKI